MKKIHVSLLAIGLLTFSNIQLSGQNTEEQMTGIKTFGLGMHVEQFKLSEIAMDLATAPANKIVFTINPTNNFRLEPEIGFNYFKDKDSDLRDKSYHVGLGGFGMIQRGKTNIYGGLRFEYARILNEYHENYDVVETEKSNRFSFGPAIGAEYFFGPNFSFGGEIGIENMALKTKNSQYNNEDTKQNYFATKTGLFVRFYL